MQSFISSELRTSTTTFTTVGNLFQSIYSVNLVELVSMAFKSQFSLFTSDIDIRGYDVCQRTLIPVVNQPYDLHLSLAASNVNKLLWWLRILFTSRSISPIPNREKPSITIHTSHSTTNDAYTIKRIHI